VGIGLSRTENQKKRILLLFTSIFVNIGFLGFFKYFDFFAESFADAFTLFGFHPIPSSLNIILPVGISFYTLQTLGYSIDVYKKNFEPTKDIISFFAFVSFFPQLVAGPIERASNLLPQFFRKRAFSYSKSVDGAHQILWGLFKKSVIADNAAIYVNDIFNNYRDYSGSTLLLGAVYFAFQIYGDFSGYSDIAIGTARLFGFKIMRNFAFPYFSRDIAEFWRRWHISLLTWFRDYVYIPLGGSRKSLWVTVRNIFIIFIVSGFWHGANWTFVFWGFINACYFLPHMLLKLNRNHKNIVAQGKMLPTIRELFQMMLTFFMTTIAWVFFRSETISDAFNYLSIIFSTSLLEPPDFLKSDFVLIIIFFILVEWFNRGKQHALSFSHTKMKSFKCLKLFYVSSLIWAIILWGAFNNKEFIYFQF